MTASTPSEPVFTAPSDVDLSGARQSFDETGFAVIENFADKTECQSLMDEADKLIRDFEPDPHATVFSTSQQQHAKDNYFRSSGDKVRFFLEEEAVDENGNLTCGKFQAVNKIGHALHDLNPVFDQFSRQNRYRRLAETLEIDKPLLLQSMFIFKHAGIGGEVNCHQDSTFLYTEPLSASVFGWL